MIPNDVDQAAILFTAYQQEAECYAQALRLADDLPAALQQGEDSAEKMRQVLACFNEVRAIEDRIAETKQHWIDDGQRPDDEFKAVLDRITDLLERLSARLQEAEQQAAARKISLIPELDSLIRTQQMQRAYNRGKTPPRPRPQA